MAASWRTVRIFLSSTFRDMHAERDHLVKVVFPALREGLEKHRVHLVDIDLLRQPDQDGVQILALQGGNEGFGGPCIGHHRIRPESGSTLPAGRETVVSAENQRHQQRHD